MPHKNLVLVNKDDSEIGFGEKLDVHRKGLMHRAFSIFLFRNGKSGLETLIQQRAENKYHSGGLWANSCCSHPAPGNCIESEVKSRLKEELGISSDLKFVGKFHYKHVFDNGLTENEVDHVFIGRLDYPEEEIPFDPSEVKAVKWIKPKELIEELETNEKHYAPWLELALKKVVMPHFDLAKR